MEKIKIKIAKMKEELKRFERLRLRKMHLDYLAGLLTLPVLLTAIVLNLNNLNRTPTTTKPEPTSPPQIIIVPGNPTNPPSATPQTCQKTIGPVVITSPTEGENVADNPVCVTISYPNTNYCPVVWSYRINNGSWSDFNNNAPCLYNLPNGSTQFQLRVNSTASSDSVTVTRNFMYSGANNAVITPTPTVSAPTSTPIPASSSATLH